MPVYTYECPKCGKRYEELSSNAEEYKVYCKCKKGGVECKKVMSVTGKPVIH